MQKDFFKKYTTMHRLSIIRLLMFFLLCHFIQTRVHTFYEMANILSHLDTWHLLVKEIYPDDPASMNLYREVLFI